MLIYLLSFLDLWTAAILVPLHFGWIPAHIAIVHSVYLFGKGIMFWGDLYSLLDVLVSFYCLFIVFGVTNIVITVLVMVYLIQKVIFTLKHWLHERRGSPMMLHMPVQKKG